MGIMVFMKEQRCCTPEVRRPSPMQGVLMDDVMQGELGATCTSFPKLVGIG